MNERATIQPAEIDTVMTLFDPVCPAGFNLLAQAVAVLRVDTLPVVRSADLRLLCMAAPTAQYGVPSLCVKIAPPPGALR